MDKQLYFEDLVLYHAIYQARYGTIHGRFQLLNDYWLAYMDQVNLEIEFFDWRKIMRNKHLKSPLGI